MNAFQILLMCLGQLYLTALILCIRPIVGNTRNLMSLMPEDWNRSKRLREAVPKYFLPECLGVMATLLVQGKHAFNYRTMPEIYAILIRVIGPEAVAKPKHKPKQRMEPGPELSYNRRLQTQTPDEILASFTGCNQLQKQGIDYDDAKRERVVHAAGGNMQREPNADASMGDREVVLEERVRTD